MSGRAKTSSGMKWLVWLLVPAGLLLVIGANAHLVYVAVRSQPDCVEQKAAGDGPVYRAARPAC
ncbi:hypothetical protein [Hansschlegelia sp. KR7-227]|uniref:hypothetical protein n=1 Tax=Hansschlegelia sp. KR7-227 TaxID=3400914 RepID=UPI003C0AAF91